MPKWMRILATLGVVVIVVGIYLSFFGIQTMSALLVRYQLRKLPDVAKTPVALTDLSISSVPHKKVAYSGYEFELPWDDIDEQKSKASGPIQITAFHSGNVFWFSTFPPKEFVSGIMKESNLDAQSFRRLYGDEAFESDYGFHKKMLLTTPSEITPFVSRKQAVAGQMLLLIKATSMPKADSGIFSIQAPDFEGFQFEDPRTRPFRITDELYSDGGGIDLIFLQKAGGSAPTISQPEINRVIQSIHRITIPTANASAASN
jgi:hypothetical protein